MRAQGAVRRRAIGALAAALLLLAAIPPGAPAQDLAGPLSPEMDRVARRLRPAIFTVFARRDVLEPVAGSRDPRALERRRLTRVGTGVAVDEEGGILTTASVVLESDHVTVRSSDGRQTEAAVVGVDLVSNVALLRARGARTTPARFSSEPRPAAGARVLVLGTSFRAQPTQSEGAVTQVFPDPRQALLQIDNPVHPGNSGAAVLDRRGELVGIVQGELGTPVPDPALRQSESRPRSAGVVLPAGTLAPVVAELRERGGVAHGFVGLRTRALSVESHSERGTQVPLGALVEGVVEGGPAARGGLAAGDLVVAFDGERVEYPGQLARWVAASRPGSTVELVWVRDETRHATRVTLTEAPAPARLAAAPPARATEIAVAAKIQELEREILRLSRELEALKGRQR